MIEFSCSCGKKYRLPDRNAGREVRCNQCTKTLVVPNGSQTEPVIPLSDSIELVIEPEELAVEQQELGLVDEKPTLKTKTETKAEPAEFRLETPASEPQPTPTAAANPFAINRQGAVKPKEPEKAKEPERPKTTVAEPKKVVPNPVATASKSSSGTAKTSPTDAAKEGFDAAVPLPHADPDTPRFLSGAQTGSQLSSCLLLALLVFALGLAGVSGGVLGWFSSKVFSPGSGTGGLGPVVDELAEQYTVAESTAEEQKTKLADQIKQYGVDVDEAIKQTDDTKRLDAMKQAQELRKTILADRDREALQAANAKFLLHLSDEFERIATSTPETVTPLKVDLSAFEKSEAVKLQFADWNVAKDPLFRFDVRTADDAPILLSPDIDPTSLKKGQKGTLDDLAVALDDSNALKGSETHAVSLRIDSASSRELAVVWPRERNAGIAGTGMKAIGFCVYLSNDANKVHKPTKPQGVDKTLEFADFRLRVGNGFGYVDYVLAEKDRIILCEKSRISWMAFSIPVDGNDVWKRTENGRSNSQPVDYIEFRATPTGQGVSFWLDNLKVE